METFNEFPKKGALDLTHTLSFLFYIVPTLDPFSDFQCFSTESQFLTRILSIHHPCFPSKNYSLTHSFVKYLLSPTMWQEQFQSLLCNSTGNSLTRTLASKVFLAHLGSWEEVPNPSLKNLHLETEFIYPISPKIQKILHLGKCQAYRMKRQVQEQNNGRFSCTPCSAKPSPVASQHKKICSLCSVPIS